MTKLTKQIISPNKVLVKISGNSKQEVIQEFWKFINYGSAVKMRACYFDQYDKGVDIEDDTGFNWLNDFSYTEGYFRTDIPSLAQTLQSIALFEILRMKDPNCNWGDIPRRIEKQAELLGLQRLNEMPEEDILNSVDKDINHS